MHQAPVFTELGHMALGTIEVTEESKARLEECTKRLARGEFHTSSSESHPIPARCVDGRLPEKDTSLLVPNAAGGTISLFVADDLTTKSYQGEDDSTLAGLRRVITDLTAKGYLVGDHTDSHASGDISGCGANDKLSNIYHYIAEHGEAMRELVVQLGIQVAPETHKLIIQNTAERHAFSGGIELLHALEQSTPNGALIDHLTGDHHEVVAVVNNRPFTTLDRRALQAEFGPWYQAFNIDVWAFQKAAQIISHTSEEAQQKMIAMVYYNVATACVLAGPHMRIVTLV